MDIILKLKTALYLDNLKLIPGKNTVTDGIKTHRAWDRLVAGGIIELAYIGEPTPIPKPSTPSRLSLSDLTIAKAKPLIEAETSPGILQAWFDADDRAGIHDLITDRLSEI